MIIVGSLLFGTIPLFVCKAYAAGLSAFDVLFFRFFFAGIVFFLMLRRKKIPLAITRRQGVVLLISGLIGYVVMNGTLFLSYYYIPIGLAQTIHFMYPVVTAIAAFFLYKQKLKAMGVVSLLLGVLGIVIVSMGNYSSGNIIGILLAAVSALAFAAYSLSIAHPQVKDMPLEKLLFYVSCITVVVIFIVELSMQTIPFARLNRINLVWVLILAIFCSVIALSFFTAGIKVMGPSIACILSTLEPVTSILLGVVILGERLTLSTLIGCLLVILSVALISLSAAKQNEMPNKEDAAAGDC